MELLKNQPLTVKLELPSPLDAWRSFLGLRKNFFNLGYWNEYLLPIYHLHFKSFDANGYILNRPVQVGDHLRLFQADEHKIRTSFVVAGIAMDHEAGGNRENVVLSLEKKSSENDKEVIRCLSIYEIQIERAENMLTAKMTNKLIEQPNTSESSKKMEFEWSGLLQHLLNSDFLIAAKAVS